LYEFGFEFADLTLTDSLGGVAAFHAISGFTGWAVGDSPKDFDKTVPQDDG
jgi:hypothetical protein